MAKRQRIEVTCARCPKPVIRVLLPTETFENGQIDGKDVLCINCRQVRSWEKRSVEIGKKVECTEDG